MLIFHTLELHAFSCSPHLHSVSVHEAREPGGLFGSRVDLEQPFIIEEIMIGFLALIGLLQPALPSELESSELQCICGTLH